jgi:hypothetical protein
LAATERRRLIVVFVSMCSNRRRNATMWKKLAAAGAVGAAVLGAGGAALAADGGSSSTSPSATSTTAPKAATRDGRLARRALHGTFVTRGKGGTFITHELARGAVTAVSPTSISVRTADGDTETYVVDSSTKVRTHVKGAKGSASTIGAVHVGDNVGVTGKGTPATATVIVDVPAAA